MIKPMTVAHYMFQTELLKIILSDDANIFI